MSGSMKSLLFLSALDVTMTK